MHRRLLAMVLLFATALQGPVLTFAASIGGDANHGAVHCDWHLWPDGKDCKSCCSHGSMPSCATQCTVLADAAVPLAFLVTQRIAIRGLAVPDTGATSFQDRTPSHPLRPPIV